MQFETLSFSIEKDSIGVVVINRPDKLNALNSKVIEELDECFTSIAENTAIKAVVVTGSGEKAFVAGADIRQFTSLDQKTAEEFARRGQSVFNRIENLGKPVIAAVNGFALGGGCELALACHVRIASTNARFGQPEVKLGVIPGYGGTQRLPRVVGRGIATELILTGEMIGADRALQIGLVSHVVEPQAILDAAIELASTIAENAPQALGIALAAIASSDLPLSEGLGHEADMFGQSFATGEVEEGVSAFLERRKPQFGGK